MPHLAASIRVVIVAAVVTCCSGVAARAQGTVAAVAAPQPARPSVCAQGVQVYSERAKIPAPFDTLRMPPAGAAIQVTNPEEAAAADELMRGRAGSVGATGILLADETIDDGGMLRMRRSVTAVFVRADSARAQQACK